ncbi:MAG: pantetheine-phosphate adenylyltransferase [Candidatus Levybacteria bacterium]|nr:pantetheine-phosphate adenylyltransferase [Candidatus Levybacteria bacterium]
MREAERTALYPGSFDPPTNGHKWVIERVSDQFDQGHVAIGINPEKPGRFQVPEREEMLRELAQAFPNISVSSFAGLFQADYAQMLGAQYVVRGIRNGADFAYESDNRHINASLNPTLETVAIIPPKDLLQVSSSMVMGFLGLEGWEQEVSKLVPFGVMRRLEALQLTRDKEYLGKKFTKLCERMGAGGNPQEVFEEIFTRWTESDRAYHNISHLKMCLSELDLVRDKLEDPDATELALVMHDAIHNEHRQDQSLHGDDEAESAELSEFLITQRLMLPQDFADRVSSRILATKHKQIPEGEDERYTADIDLAIFGRSERLYQIYEERVRKEYGWVPTEAFRAGRGRVLTNFLNRPTIYHTEFFRNRYEKSARKNVSRAIQNLAA